MKPIRIAMQSVFVAAIVAAAASLFVNARKGVETDLFGMLGNDMRCHGLGDLVEKMAGRGRILVEAGDYDTARANAEEMARLFSIPPSADIKDTIKYLSTRKSGLLSSETRAKLLAGRYDEVARDSADRLFGFAHPLFSMKEDPFLLATDYVLQLESSAVAGWTLRDGMMFCEQGGRSFIFLSRDFTGTSSEDLLAKIKTVKAFNDGHPEGRVWLGGSPFHSAVATENSKREVAVLSIVSVLGVFVIGLVMFRSLRFVPVLLAALAVGAVAATAALFGCFDRPHVLTFVFGTSLIGLSVDYVYHALSSRAEHTPVLAPLRQSLFTTLLCFVPLVASQVAVIGQMAIFTGAGLVAVFAFVTLFVVRGDASVEPRTPPELPKSKHRTSFGWIALMMIPMIGITMLRPTDPSGFYRPDPTLAAGERRFAELGQEGATRFLLIRGREGTLQSALEAEEARGIPGLSRVIPSLKRQRENVDLIARLHSNGAAAFTELTGIKVNPPAASALLDASEITDPNLRQMTDVMVCGDRLLAPCPKTKLFHLFDVDDDAYVRVLDPKADLEMIFSMLTRSTSAQLLIASILVVLIMTMMFRNRVHYYVMPLVCAFACTLGVMGWFGVKVSFFTMISLFVLLGLGIDYVIFHQNPEMADAKSARSMHRTVFYSFLTSLLGLGALAFTSFPVTRSMGITFAVGLTFAYGFSQVGFRERLRNLEALEKSGGDGNWHEQKEQSAGRFRILFMWYAYRIFGKTFQKLVFIPAMCFIYPFCFPARRALRQFYSVLSSRSPSHWTMFRHMLGFAWSMMDKTDACSLRKNLPKMSVREDGGWREFRKLLADHRGAFLISTHVGTIEVLPAARGLTPEDPHMHAFQQMGHDAEFTRVFMSHFDKSKLTLHAVEDIGVETAVEMKDAIDRGDLVLMAGDRVSAGSGKRFTHEFLGRECAWPKGVFAFAKMMESPIFFVTCVRTGWNSYEVHFERYSPEVVQLKSLLDAYVSFLERETLEHPEQWYQFYEFFNSLDA